MSDELEGLDGLPANSPLHDLMLAELEAQPLEVDAAAAGRVAGAALGRMPRSRAWNGLIALAAAATLAVVGWTAVEGPTDVLDAATSWFEDPADREVALRTEAVTLHQEGRTEDDPAKLAAADAVYADWFADFAGSERDATMRYAWAELKYKRGEFAAAYDLYTDVVVDHPDSDKAEFCARSALFAADELVTQQAQDGLDRYAQAVERYLAGWSDADVARGAIYKAGYHFYAAQQLDRALPWLERAVAHDPASPEAARALNLIVDVHLTENDLPGVVDRLLEAFADTPQAIDADLVEVSAKLVEHFAASDPARSQALDAARSDWLGDQLETVGDVDDED